MAEKIIIKEKNYKKLILNYKNDLKVEPGRVSKCRSLLAPSKFYLTPKNLRGDFYWGDAFT